MFTLTVRDFEETRARIAPHIKHTPLLTSRQLSDATVRRPAKADFPARGLHRSVTAQRSRSCRRSRTPRRVACRPKPRRGGARRQDPRHSRRRLHGRECHARQAAATKPTAPKSSTARSGTRPTEGEGARARSRAHVRPPFDEQLIRAGTSARDHSGLAGGRRGRRRSAAATDRRRRWRSRASTEDQSDRWSRPTDRDESERRGGLVPDDDRKTIIDGLVRRAESQLSVVQRFVDETVAPPDREIFDAMIGRWSAASWSWKARRGAGRRAAMVSENARWLKVVAVLSAT